MGWDIPSPSRPFPSSGVTRRDTFLRSGCIPSRYSPGHTKPLHNGLLTRDRTWQRLSGVRAAECLRGRRPTWCFRAKRPVLIMACEDS